MSTGPIRTIDDLKKRIIALSEGNDIIFIAPHIAPDIDGLGSALALTMIANSLSKESYIIIDEDYNYLENGVKTVLKETPESLNIINANEANEVMKDKKVLLITTDTNKLNLIPFDNTDEFNNVLVIDHHETDKCTIDTDDMYINTKVSSTCEIMYLLLSLMNIPLDYSNIETTDKDITNIANYLLGGIVLDTSNFKRNTSSETLQIAANLLNCGAKLDYSHSLFLDDFNTDVRVGNLVGKSTLQSYSIAYAYNTEEPEFIYKKEDLAKVADRLIKPRNTDASFVFGYVSTDTISISARSKGAIKVNEIMEYFGGGGTATMAGARVTGIPIDKIKEKLTELTIPGNLIEEKGNCLKK